jgi:hypothetical protein
MRAYVDKMGTGNISDLVDLTFETDHSHPLTCAGFEMSDDRTFSEPGVYIVSVKYHVDWWGGKTPGGPNRHVLYEVPLDVLQAARDGKVIIVIDQQAEGFTLNEIRNIDGFKDMHDAMHNLKLKKGTVLFVDGNFGFENEYTSWCIYNNIPPITEHVPFFTHTFYFHGTMPSKPLIEEAMVNLDAKDFNSLNRTVRYHRIAHLFKILVNGWEKKGLVSGHWTNDASNKNSSIPYQFFTNVPEHVYGRFLKVKLPLHVDGDFVSSCSLSPDISKETIFNHSIYKNSLLSVVTETAYHRSGMFYTEKIFKPIAAGHPFMVLGPVNLLRRLRQLGYETDFFVIDQSYDENPNPIERFEAMHESLGQWIMLSQADKFKKLKQSLDKIKHNQELFRQSSYERDSYARLKEKAEKIFKNAKDNSQLR